jgi:hypothetical protein
MPAGLESESLAWEWLLAKIWASLKEGIIAAQKKFELQART